MRLLRVLAAASTIAALLAQPSAAQEGRQFKDAWFWGVKGGLLNYSSASTLSATAPLVGAEWLITRTRGGLYVSYDQAFLTTQGAFVDRDGSGAVFLNPVDIKDVRRLSAAAMVFPMQQPNLHPYVGLGFTYYRVGHAVLSATSPTTPGSPRYALAQDSILEKKTAISPLLMAGAQFRLQPVSVFVHGTVSPTQKDFFLARGESSRLFYYGLEFGLRYNVGSSIDRVR
jgi:hypothetical protein